LLGKGADVNAQYRVMVLGNIFTYNTLGAAAEQGREKVVERLLDAGADVDANYGQYGSALYVASLEGHDGVVEVLLRRGADVNIEGGNAGSALCAASSVGHEKVVRLLLEAGADVNVKDRYIQRALSVALSRGHEEVAELLIESSDTADIQAIPHDSEQQTASWTGYEAAVLQLREERGPLDERDWGRTLYEASRRGDTVVVRQVLKQDEGRPWCYGNASLAASDAGHTSIAELLASKPTV
jgi:ankyrin repeat protein